MAIERDILSAMEIYREDKYLLLIGVMTIADEIDSQLSPAMDSYIA
jgi:hypothetical protein